MILNGKNLCSHCFKEIAEEETMCENCLQNPAEAFRDELPPETVLKGRYILGRTMYYDFNYYCYMAYDTEKESNALIREFFPIALTKRRDNKEKNLVCHFLGREEEKEFNELFSNLNFAIQTSELFNKRSFSLPVYDNFTENNTIYTVTEYPEGSVLLSEKLKNGPLSRVESKNIIKKIIEALEVIHASGHIHGNLRPESIVLNGSAVYLTSYHHGMFQHHITSTIAEVSCDYYASMEQTSSNKTIDCRADIYSLGSLWYKMLTGKTPEAAMYRIMNDSYYTEADGLPEEEMLIINKMCEAIPEKRYGSIFELAKDINESGLMRLKVSSNALAVVKSSEAPKKDNKKPVIIITALILALAIVAGAGIYFFVNRDKDSADPGVNTETTETSETGEAVGEEPSEGDGGEGKPEEEPSEGDGSEGKPEEEPSEENGGEGKPEEEPSEGDGSEGKPEEEPSEGDGSEGKPAQEPKDSEDTPMDNRANTASSNISWINNVMRAGERSEWDTKVFGNRKYKKSSITSVQFCNTLANMGENAWDVSEAQNKSVMAWVTDNKLYIGAEGGINAKDSSIALFYNYRNLKEVDFANSYYTEKSTDMNSMFENCVSLTKIEFSSTFITSNVKDMAQMFDSCKALTNIDLSAFNTGRVMNMSKMFWDCRSVEYLNLSNFSGNMVMSVSEMFKKCTKLKKIDFGSFAIKDTTNTENMFAECKSLTELVCNDTKIKETHSGKNKFSIFGKKNQ